MIVESMTVNEIQIELSRDLDNCMNKIAIECRKIRRTIIKSKRFPVHFEPVEFISSNQNRYLIFLEASSKKNAESPIFTLVAMSLMFSPRKTDRNAHSERMTTHYGCQLIDISSSSALRTTGSRKILFQLLLQIDTCLGYEVIEFVNH